MIHQVPEEPQENELLSLQSYVGQILHKCGHEDRLL